MNDKFKIHLEIAGRKYPLNIKREDEEIVRQAAALVNKKLLRLRETRDVEIFTGIVREIDEELDSYLNQK